jgi:hypothetical protein
MPLLRMKSRAMDINVPVNTVWKLHPLLIYGVTGGEGVPNVCKKGSCMQALPYLTKKAIFV